MYVQSRLLLEPLRSSGLLHRHDATAAHSLRPGCSGFLAAPQAPSVPHTQIEALNPKITVPEGYSCSTVDDLLVAFRLLGGREAVVKPLYGKEGTGVLLVSSPEELRLYGGLTALNC